MDKLLSLKETEHLLNVSKSTLQRWDNSHKLIALRTEGDIFPEQTMDISCSSSLGLSENP